MRRPLSEHELQEEVDRAHEHALVLNALPKLVAQLQLIEKCILKHYEAISTLRELSGSLMYQAWTIERERRKTEAARSANERDE